MKTIKITILLVVFVLLFNPTSFGQTTKQKSDSLNFKNDVAIDNSADSSYRQLKNVNRVKKTPNKLIARRPLRDDEIFVEPEKINSKK